MSGLAQRKNLVVVRAGKNSLHPLWLQNAEERTWDLVVSLYDPEVRLEPSDGVRIETKRGGKWDGIHSLFANSDLLNRYEYVWLPDDDIAATCADINAIFAAMRQYELEVAQPALTWDSYFSHFVFMRCPGFTLRYSQFIEIMVPCLRASLLAQVLDDFQGSMSGYGMDSVWCRLSAHPRYKAAILDFVTVQHTRPVGKVLRGNMANRGLTPESEERVLHARYGLRGRIRPLIYAAIFADGELREGGSRLGMVMAWRYAKIFRRFRSGGVIVEKIWQLIRRQIGYRPNLEPLHPVDASD